MPFNDPGFNSPSRGSVKDFRALLKTDFPPCLYEQQTSPDLSCSVTKPPEFPAEQGNLYRMMVSSTNAASSRIATISA